MKEWKQFIRGKMWQNLTKGSHCVTKIRLKKKTYKIFCDFKSFKTF